MTAECPECGSPVQLPEDVLANEILECDTCGIELEAVSVSPLKLEPAPEEKEDWGE
jgi:alpha-aminoadipate carrier protein LysW